MNDDVASMEESKSVSKIIAEVVRDSETGDRTDTTTNLVRYYLHALKRQSRRLYILHEHPNDEEDSTLDLFCHLPEQIMFNSQTGFPFYQTNEHSQSHSSWATNVFDNYEEGEDWQWHSSQPLTTFSTRGQIRPGSKHGKGRRLPGSAAQVRTQYSKYARIVLYNRLYNLISVAMDSNGSAKRVIDSAYSVAQSMTENVASQPMLSGLSNGKPTPRQVQKALLGELEHCTELTVPKSIEYLPRSVLGVTARFTKSDFVEPKVARTLNVRERHVITTWVDKKGGVRCTCIGSTQYEIYALNGEFGTSCCIHTQAVTDILLELCSTLFGNPSVPIKVLYMGFASICPESVESIDSPSPMFQLAHGGNTILFISEDISQENQLCWSPIRKVQRGGGRPLCAFCDMTDPNQCYHVSAFRKHCGEDPINNANHNISAGGEALIAVGETPSSIMGNGQNPPSVTRNNQPVSNLPLSPVNCPLAIRVDQEVCDFLKANGVFKLNAPTLCTYCKFQRIVSTRETNTSGIVMCSLGACAMEIETYVCSRCKRRFSAEGRKEGVFVDSLCLAATHKLSRDQLTGFALGNGTISSRLSQFHSQVTAFEDARVFNTQLPSRSTRRLYDLCIYSLRLMVCDPPVSIFNCDTCQDVSVTTAKEKNCRLRAVCVDGIWAGYQKRTVVPFQNVSQPCNPPKSFSRSVKSSFQKPQTSFFRLEKTVTYLLRTIKGKAIETTISSITAIVAAVRVTSENALPADFHASSICGTFPTDYKNDIGEGYLKSLKGLTISLFHRETVLYRLLEPLQKLFQRQGKRRKTSKDSTNKASKKKWDDTEAYNTVALAISHISNLDQTEECVAWNEELEPIAKEGDFGSKILRLYTAIMQGPLTHLIKRNEITSAAVVAKSCLHYNPKNFMRAMVKKQFHSGLGTANEIPEGAHILQNLRILASGLFCASVVDKKLYEVGKRMNILQSFGKLLQKAVRLVEHFCIFYDNHVSTGSTTAAEYAMEWQVSDFDHLREKFKDVSTSKPFQPSWGNDYDDPFVTGAYFTSLPQVRPFPFNDQKGKVADSDSYGFCSKHYLQRNASFTPGALNFSCSCSHPKVLGFKVLERDEGPRAVLGVLVSRFASIPPFIVYDFACGVYKSAVNSLWWVVQSSTLVSDPFHANNHTYSPAFVPSSHVKLNMLNTISHEQRNRPIAKIKNSLQQTGQDVYISLLAYQIIINNIEAKGRRAEEEQSPVPNRSAKDIEWAFFHRLRMCCYCCTKPEKSR